jgi:hypothetical protein
LVRLQNSGLNRFAIGAQVGLVQRARPPRWRRVATDSSYLSANDVRVHFGLGNDPAIDAVLVRWPDGQTERFEGVKSDRVVTLHRGDGKHQ